MQALVKVISSTAQPLAKIAYRAQNLEDAKDWIAKSNELAVNKLSIYIICYNGREVIYKPAV